MLAFLGVKFFFTPYFSLKNRQYFLFSVLLYVCLGVVFLWKERK